MRPGLLCSSVCQWMDVILHIFCVTLLVLWYHLVTKLAALFCTISSLCLALAVWGFQAHVAFSVGLTRAWYARVFTVSDGVRIFLYSSTL